MSNHDKYSAETRMHYEVCKTDSGVEIHIENPTSGPHWLSSDDLIGVLPRWKRLVYRLFRRPIPTRRRGAFVVGGVRIDEDGTSYFRDRDGNWIPEVSFLASGRADISANIEDIVGGKTE